LLPSDPEHLPGFRKIERMRCGTGFQESGAAFQVAGRLGGKALAEFGDAQLKPRDRQLRVGADRRRGHTPTLPP
jgi:hypothetical protein